MFHNVLVFKVLVRNLGELGRTSQKFQRSSKMGTNGMGALWFVLLNRWMSERISFPKLDYGEPTRKGGNNFVCMSFCKHESLGLESDKVRWGWKLGFIALCVQRSIMGVEVEGFSSNKRTPLRYWATSSDMNKNSRSTCLLYSTFSMLMLACRFPSVPMLSFTTNSPFLRRAWSSFPKCNCI